MPLIVTPATAPQNQPAGAADAITAHQEHPACNLLLALLKQTGYDGRPLPAEIGNVVIDSNNIDLFNMIFVKMYEATRDKNNELEIEFSDQFRLSLLSCDDDLIIGYNEKCFELKKLTIKTFTDRIIDDYFEHPASYENTLLADFILQLAPISNGVDQIKIHKKIDTLYKIYCDVPQPCFIAAAYMMEEKPVSPFDFSVSASVLAPLRQGHQFDIGLCMLDGDNISQERHGVDFSVTQHVTGRTSLQAEIRPCDLFTHAESIRKGLATNLGDRCILLTSSNGIGHFCYYDIKNDIVCSGGTPALKAEASGIKLVEYMATKYAEDNETQQVTLFCTNNSANKVANIIARFG